jgi:hypothetical protein
MVCGSARFSHAWIIKRSEGMEIQPTVIAAIGVSTRCSEEQSQLAFSDPLLAEVLHSEIAASGAARVAHEVHGDVMGIETPPALHAAPRPQGCKANYSVDKPVAARPYTVLSFAGWTNHSFRCLQGSFRRQHIKERLPVQPPACSNFVSTFG